MNVLRTLRPSNVILIAAMPFIIYLFVSTNNYKRSIYAIVGIGENASTLFASFLCALAIFCAGFWLAYSLLKNPEKSKASQLGQNAALIIYFTLLALIATNAVDLSIFVDSIVANSVDPYTSDLIQKAVRPRQLTPEAQVLVLSIFSKATFAYLIASLGLLLIHFLSKSKQALVSLSRYGLTLLLLTNALGAFYILFVAHAGFAAGLMVTLRAAFFAYFASMILGLIWAGLQSLEKKKHTNLFYSIAALIFFGLCAFFVMQPQQSYSLIGSLEGRVAIIKGTPQPVTDQIRFGEYDGANHTSIDIRSVKDPSHALITVEKNKRVSAAFIPTEAVPADANLIWQTSFLPDESKYPAITFGVLGFFTMLLVVCSIYRAEHPLAIAAEFFIDTVRGIPMLVIILYVGLPLSGAIKSASDGAINLSNMTRGIVAISIGYSATWQRSSVLAFSLFPKADRSGQKPWPKPLASRTFCSSTSGPVHRHTATRQRVHRHAQGHILAVHPLRSRRYTAYERVSGEQLLTLRPVQLRCNSLCGPHTGRSQHNQINRETL